MGKVLPFIRKDEDSNTLIVSYKDGKVYGSSKHKSNMTHEERMQRLIDAIKSVNKMFEEYKNPPRT